MLNQNCLRRPSRTASTAWTWPLNQQGHLRSEIWCIAAAHCRLPCKDSKWPERLYRLYRSPKSKSKCCGHTRHMKAQRDNAKHLQPHAVERQLAPSDVSQWGSEDTKQANSGFAASLCSSRLAGRNWALPYLPCQCTHVSLWEESLFQVSGERWQKSLKVQSKRHLKKILLINLYI